MPVQYKQFRIGELFDVSTGSLLKIKEVPEGNIPRISVRSDNNGILGYYDTEGNSDARHAENFISVNFFGNAFYHPYKASLEMKVHCLKLKDREFTEAIGLYLTSVLNKVFAQKHYSYGEQLSSSDLKKQDLQISLPVTPSGTPDWDYMQEYISELEQERVSELEKYLAATGLDDYELTDDDREVLEISGFRRDENGKPVGSAGGRKEMREFRIGGLFDIKKVYGEPISKYLAGKFSYVTGSENDNGVVGYVDAPGSAVSKGGCISVDPIKGFACWQPVDFVGRGFSGASINLLYNPNLNESSALFVCTAIAKVSKNVAAYTNLFNSSRLANAEISLPVTSSGTPDWDFMSRYIRAIEKMVVKDVVDYKDEFIARTKAVVS